MRQRRRREGGPKFVGPHDHRCRGCGQRFEPLTWQVCTDCRAECLNTLAMKLCQEFKPPLVPKSAPERMVAILTADAALKAMPDGAWHAGPAEIYPCLEATEIVEAYQGWHINHDVMFGIIFPIAELEKRRHKL